MHPEFSIHSSLELQLSWFVIQPDAPWLGSMEGLPSENPQFDLIEIKCPNVKSYVDYPHFQMQSGKLELKPQHAYYWQVQSQLLTTGMQCDFVVCTKEDTLIQCIYRDSAMIQAIKARTELFFFSTYMHRCL